VQRGDIKTLKMDGHLGSGRKRLRLTYIILEYERWD